MTIQYSVTVQCCTFFIFFIVDVCFGTVTQCIYVIWFCCQHFITTAEGIVNVLSLHIIHKPMTTYFAISIHLYLNCKP